MAKTNYDYIAIVNAINANVGGMYGYEFPIINSSNFKSMAAVLMNAPTMIQNAWIDTLMNISCKTALKKIYPAYNPFRYLYGDDIGLDGEDSQYVREVAIDQIIPVAYEKCSGADDFFKCNPPKVRVQYICNVLRSRYPVSVNFDLLVSAFATYGEFDSFYTKITERMMYDMENDDKEAIMAMLNGVVEGGNIYLIPQARPTDSVTALNFAKTLEQLQYDLSFYRSRRYNMNRLSTSTNPDQAVAIIAGDVIATQNKYNVAWAFNESVLKLLKDGRMIKIGSGGIANNKVYALYTDRDYFKINNIKNFPRLKMWDNPADLTQNQWLHNWKRFAISYFSNAVAFANPEDIGVKTVEVKTKNDVSTVKKGGFLLMDLAKVTPADGKICDAVCTYTIAGATDQTTRIDSESGDIYCGKNETAATLTVTATSHLDATKTGTKEITVTD